MSGLPDTHTVSVSTAGYEDGLGRRSVRFDREVGGMLECLHLRPELWGFEQDLRTRADAVASLEDERFVRVRAIERGPTGLVVVSEMVPGGRLVDFVDARLRDDSAAFGLDAGIGFLLQALPALATMHTLSMAHGALAPGRILVTPASRIVLLDGLYAAALERLNLSRSAMWANLGLLASPFAGAPRFDRQADVVQAVCCALVLAIGRPLEGSGATSTLAPLVRELRELAEIRAGGAFAEGVHRFFSTALPIGSRPPHLTADAAALEIERLAEMIGEEGCHAAFTHLTRLGAAPVSVPIVAEEDDLDSLEFDEDDEPRGSEFAEADVESSNAVSASIVDAAELEHPARPLPIVASTPVAPSRASDSLQNRIEPELSTPAVPLPVLASTPAPAISPPTSPMAAPGTVMASQATVVSPDRLPFVPGTPFVPPVATAAPPAPAPPVVMAPVIQVAPPIAALQPPAPAAFSSPPPPAMLPAPVAVPVPPAPGAITPQTIRVAAPITVAPIAPLPAPSPVVSAPQIGIAVAQPAAVRVRNQPPPGYTPPRMAPAPLGHQVLPFGQLPAEAPNRLPWKLAAAAVIVLAVGGFAGRTYLTGPAETAPPPSEPPRPVAAAGLAPTVGKTGGLAIDTQPTGAKVSIDGADAGVTPLKLENLSPGKHTVVVTTEQATVRRTVRVEAGRIVTLDIPVYAGWVVVFSPIPLDIASGGSTLGNTDTGRIIMPPGRHVLTLTNREYGFSDTRTVEIISGEERPLNVEPKGMVNVNAHPWAEVWIDGKKAGDTPIANLPVLLGARTFVFRHPQYGERRLTRTITSTPTALTIDLTKP